MVSRRWLSLICVALTATYFAFVFLVSSHLTSLAPAADRGMPTSPPVPTAAPTLLPTAAPVHSTALHLLAQRLRTAVADAKALVKLRKAEYHDQPLSEHYQELHEERHLHQWATSVRRDKLETRVMRAAEVSGISTVVVATYNIWNLGARWEARRSLVRAELLARQSDVVGLQEVRRFSNGTLQLDQLLQHGLRELYPHVLYQPANTELEGDGEQGIEEGVAILSKYPILKSHVLELEPPEDAIDPSRRLVLHATVLLPCGTALEVLNAHLSWADWQQCLSVRVVREYLAGLSLQAGVLLGDLNLYFGYEWPFDTLLQDRATLAELASLPDNPCLQDHKAASGLAAPRFADSLAALGMASLATFSAVEDFNSPGNDNPGSQPDKIFVSGALAVIAGAPFGLQKAVDGVQASDHLGVWAGFGIAKNGTGVQWAPDGKLSQLARELRKQSARIVSNHGVFERRSQDVGGLLNATTLRRVLGKSKIPDLIKNYDADKDGNISYQEIFKFLHPTLGKLLPSLGCKRTR